jgi:hypothetical protein
MESKPLSGSKLPYRILQGGTSQSRLIAPYEAAFSALSILSEEIQAGIDLKMFMSRTGGYHTTRVELIVPKAAVAAVVNSPTLLDIAENCACNKEIPFLSNLPCQGFLDAVALQLGFVEAYSNCAAATQALHGIQVCFLHRKRGRVYSYADTIKSAQYTVRTATV